jgi:hypothetical protein
MRDSASDRLRRLSSSDDFSNPVRRRGTEHSDHEINQPADERQPQKAHEEPDHHTEQTDEKLERQNRHYGEDSESDQVPQHGIILRGASQAAVRPHVSKSFIYHLSA